MSVFSGKYDIFDHICGCAGWYDRNGNPVKFGEGRGAYYSDEYRDFLEFKKRTGGVMYQHQKVKVTEWNQDEVAKKLPGKFEVIEHEHLISDKRCKEGHKTKVTYTYKYWGKEYLTLKDLNKHGVWVTIDIRFDTILDLIPYYPYIVSACCSNDGKETVFISKESFVISKRDEHFENGYFSDSWQSYTKKLQEHYLDVCRDYICYKLDERVRVTRIDAAKFRQSVAGGDYVMDVDDDIDFNHPIEFVWEGEVKPHWGSPKRVGDREIAISRQDVESFLKEYIKNGTVKVKYVAMPAGGFPLSVR